jgi:hypothetical protein
MQRWGSSLALAASMYEWQKFSLAWLRIIDNLLKKYDTSHPAVPSGVKFKQILCM